MLENCHVTFYMFIAIVVIIIKLLNHIINVVIMTVIITGISNNKKNVCSKPTAYLPTLPVFPGVSKFFIKSPDLPVRAPNLPDKMDFWAFLCFSLKFSPFFHKIRTFFIHCTVSGTFLHMFSQWQRLVHHYNDESAVWSHVRHVRRHIMS